MVNKNFLKILRCPKCRGDLRQRSPRKIICSGCNKEYDVISAVPVMLPESGNRKSGKSKWHEIYHRLIKQEEIEKEIAKYKKYYLKPTFGQIKPWLIYPKGSYYLEAGCGLTVMGMEMSKRGYRIFGIDNNLDILLKARSVYKERGIEGNFVCGDLVYCPFKDNTFDFIYSGSTIEHIEETDRVVREFSRILNPQGRVFNTVPYASLGTIIYGQRFGNIPQVAMVKEISEFIHYKVFERKFNRFGLEKSYTIKQMKGMFEYSGLKVLYTGKFEVYLELSGIKSEILKNLLRELASKSILFWPMIKVIAQK